MLKRSAALELLTVAGFCAFLFFFGLDSFGLVGADEPRYAQVAREMAEHRDWITPRLHGEPWLEKPVLYYWGAALSFRLFGVGDWQARLPSGLMASALVLFIYFFLRRFRPGRELDGALITASCAALIGFGRGASFDIQIATPFAAGMLAWWGWHETGRKSWLALFYALMGLATLGKGPVAVVLAVLVVGAFALIRREVRLALHTLWLPGILLFLAVALPWYAAVQVRTPEFFRVFFLEHNLARMVSNVFRHKQPVWYYALVLPVALLPWTALSIAGLLDALRRWRRAAPGLPDANDAWSAFLAVWGLVPVVFFTLSQSKLPGYILPGIPALTILTAEYVHSRQKAGARGGGLLLGHALTAGFVMGFVIVYPNVLAAWFNPGVGVPRLMVLVSAAIAILGIAAIAATLRVQGWRMVRFVTLVPVILGMGYTIRVGSLVVDATQSARPVARELARIEGERLPVAVYGATRHTEYGLGFYRNAPVPRYTRDPVPSGDHIVVARGVSRQEVQRMVGERRIAHVGGFPAQDLHYFWVSGEGGGHPH